LLFFVKSRTIELREWNTKHKKETIFPITGTVIRRKLGKAFEAVGGKVTPEVGTKSGPGTQAFTGCRINRNDYTGQANKQ